METKERTVDGGKRERTAQPEESSAAKEAEERQESPCLQVPPSAGIGRGMPEMFLPRPRRPKWTMLKISQGLMALPAIIIVAFLVLLLIGSGGSGSLARMAPVIFFMLALALAFGMAATGIWLISRRKEEEFREETNQWMELSILNMAGRHRAGLTVPQVVLEVGVGLNLVMEAFERLTQRGVARTRVGEDGSLIYLFSREPVGEAGPVGGQSAGQSPGQEETPGEVESDLGDPQDAEDAEQAEDPEDAEEKGDTEGISEGMKDAEDTEEAATQEEGEPSAPPPEVKGCEAP